MAAAKKTPKKASASRKKAASGKEVAELSYGGNKEQQLSIRKIKNGYITRKSGMVGKGPTARYVEDEVFTRTMPRVVMPGR